MQIRTHQRPPRFDIRQHLLNNPHLLSEANITLLSELFGDPDYTKKGLWGTFTPQERYGKYVVIMAAFEIPADYRPTYEWVKKIKDIAYKLEAVVTRGLEIGTKVKSRRHGYVGKITMLTDDGRVLVDGRRNLCSARDFDRVE